MIAVQVERILIVGLGSIGQRHLRLARQLLPDADIRVLRHRHVDGTPEYANSTFFDLHDALVFRPQLAVIASPAPMHAKAAIALAGVGAHLLIEKPLAATVSDGEGILATCKAAGVICQVAYNLRFLPSLRRFRELLVEGVVGRIVSVRCEIGQYLPSWRPDKDYRDAVSANRSLGGGALLELSHELDYLRWLFGEYAWVKSYLGTQSRLEIDVEDTVHVLIGFAPDELGKEVVANLSMDFVRHDTTRVCTVIGEDGSLRWDAISGQLEICWPGGYWSPLASHKTQRDDSYIAEWQCWLSAIETRTLPEVTLEDGLRVLNVIDAIRSASQFDKTIRL
jgi:predicted dehydrogenase